MAAITSEMFSQRMFRSPRAAKMPAVVSSESPGRKKPTIRPVSAKTMMIRPTDPTSRTSSGTL
jgi:hypothetical protein